VPCTGKVDRRKTPAATYFINLNITETFGSAWLEPTDLKKTSIKMVMALGLRSGLSERP
jgi:hypothetical protein